MFNKKARLKDDKINTPEELLEMDNEKVWEHDPMTALKFERLERRKILNWVARMILSMVVFGIFILLIWLLFFGDLPQGSRDLVNIMIGAFVATVTKTGDYWFKSDDNESKEHADMNNSNVKKERDDD
jgi:hypothetical protein